MVPLLSLIPLVQPVIDRLLNLIPDPAAREKAAAEAQAALTDVLSKSDALQVSVNNTEAQSASVFVAGWRPFCGWVCGLGLAYEFLLRPLLPWFLLACGLHVPLLPELSADILWPLLSGMLGLASVRGIESIRGVARQSMSPRR